MDHTTVNRWIRGERVPTGKGLQRLLAWCEKTGGPAAAVASSPKESAAAALALAKEQTAETLAALERVHDYAQTVQAMLQRLADTQRSIVDELAAWVEDDQRTKEVRAELDATAVTPAVTPPAPAAPRRKARGQ